MARKPKYNTRKAKKDGPDIDISDSDSSVCESDSSSSEEVIDDSLSH